MEILTSHSNSKNEKKLNKKKEILYKFKIKEGKNINKYLGKSYFIHLNSFIKISKNRNKKTPVKTKNYLPILNLDKNVSIEKVSKGNKDNKYILNNKNKLLKFHKRYKSKDEIIKTTIVPNEEINPLNDSKKYIKITNNVTFSESDNTNGDTLSKNKINNFSPIKTMTYDEILQKSEKNELRFIKLSNINYNKKKLFGEHIKCKFENKNEDYEYNPIKLNNEGSLGKTGKIILGAKYSTFDSSPDSISKNKFNTKLNNYIKKIKEKKKSNKKINLSKIDLHNLRLKSYHNNRIKNFRKLIDSTVKEVTEVKKSCLNWVNELREKYSDLYKGFGIEKNDDYY
jgi:hypothetical protein